tara:strand:- start:382 stop:675 length:294 start_codon:yes stop_codon:yes gene_type:complete
MTIFKDVNEIKHCVMEWDNILPREDYLLLLTEIDNTKSYDLDDKNKQHMCLKWIRHFVLKNNITKSYNIKEWLTEQRDNYREMIAYAKRASNWKSTE